MEKKTIQKCFHVFLSQRQLTQIEISIHHLDFKYFIISKCCWIFFTSKLHIIKHICIADVQVHLVKPNLLGNLQFTTWCKSIIPHCNHHYIDLLLPKNFISHFQSLCHEHTNKEMNCWTPNNLNIKLPKPNKSHKATNIYSILLDHLLWILITSLHVCENMKFIYK